MLSVKAFQRELAHRGALHNLLGRYSQMFVAQMVQSTACNTKPPAMRAQFDRLRGR